MRSFLLIIASLYAIVTITKQQSKISEDFFQVSAKCMEYEHIPENYRTQLNRFQYVNETIIYKYIYCVAKELNIWNDNDGFNIEKIYEQYRGRTNDEIVLPIIVNCNKNTKVTNKELWSYRAFICILETQVGVWFKADVKRVQQQQQQQPLLNGH